MYSKIIHNDGSVVWLAPVVYLSLCRLESFYFPFDEQKCEFNFRSSSYNDLELEFVNMSAAGDMSAYASNGEWDIVAIPVSTNRTCCSTNPELTYTAVLQVSGFVRIESTLSFRLRAVVVIIVRVRIANIHLCTKP